MASCVKSVIKDGPSNVRLTENKGVIDLTSDDEPSENDNKMVNYDLINMQKKCAENIQLLKEKVDKYKTEKFDLLTIDLDAIREDIQHEECHECEVCDEKFRFKIGLISHLSSTHHIDYNYADYELMKKRNKCVKKTNKLVLKKEKCSIELGSKGKKKKKVSNNKILNVDLNKSVNVENKVLPKLYDARTNSIMIKKANKCFIKSLFGSKGIFKCKNCSKELESRKDFVDHYKEYHFKNYTCQFCTKSVTSQSLFRKHMIKTHDFLQFVFCLNCSKVLPDVTSLNLHVETCKKVEIKK